MFQHIFHYQASGSNFRVRSLLCIYVWLIYVLYLHFSVMHIVCSDITGINNDDNTVCIAKRTTIIVNKEIYK